MSRTRAYVFTVNNYDETDENTVFACAEDTEVKYIVVGKEVGESGTPHLQGYIYFNQKKSLAQLKAYWPTAHCEPKRGTHKQASDYCKKEGDFFEHGTLPADDCGSAGAAAMEALMAQTIEAVRDGDYKSIPAAATHFIRAAEYRVLKEQMQDRNMETLNDDLHEHNFWYYGEAGTGKSRKARDENPDAFLKMCNKWWDDYKGEDCVIIEDFDKAHHVLAHHLKIWADRYKFPAEVKGTKIDLRPKKIIVTSNYHPSEIWSHPSDLQPILRRFKVVHFLGNVGEHVVTPIVPRYEQEDDMEI